MRLTYFAYIAASVCLVGIIYRMGRWLVLSIGPERSETTPDRRGAGAAGALVKTLRQPHHLLALVRAFFVDIVAQVRILKQSPLRWAVHMGVSFGILALLLFHTFDEFTVEPFFNDYASTLAPYMLLRNLMGLLVLIGVIVALIRRRKDPLSCGADRLLLFLLAVVILSGAALEAAQIISPSIFSQMVEDYMGSDDLEEIAPLKAYWAKNFEVAFTPPPIVETPILDQGAELHADYCAACHSRPASAVMAYPIAKAAKSLAAPLIRFEPERWLWYAHYLISCIVLALLPFTKLFHLIATPVSLMTRALGPASTDTAVNRLTRRAMGLDACTHCGECSRHCAVAPIYRVIPTREILPSEKISAVARWAALSTTAKENLQLAEGSFICTACGRCTRCCPSGIDLQDLWAAVRSDLPQDGLPDLQDRMRRHSAAHWAELLTACDSSQAESLLPPVVKLMDDPATFWACAQCAICTNVCPVVAADPDPPNVLGMTPQQVMNLMRLNLKEAAMGAPMVWDCLTCYKCQEHCPQKVRVADVLYELRNAAYRRLRENQEALSAPSSLEVNVRPTSPKGKKGV